MTWFEMAHELSARLRKLRDLAMQVTDEVQAVCDAKSVSIPILRASRLGKESVKTARVVSECHAVINEAISGWKALALEEREMKKVQAFLVRVN